ncbi:MAG TPA: type II toxin-antitoxin system VapC family toxin [Pyrinomonadaceae bacterium]|nr:type II toxin-antitoxin system VapC family toxin [Pyrinomonadaceae bacterium]
MITPDANIVLYAYNDDAPKHTEAKEWLEEQFSQPAVFGLSWQVITAFLRISTNPRAFPQPFSLQEAIEIVDEWIKHPNIEILTPTANHWAIFQSLIIEGQTKAALMMDAHLAALTIEHGATLATTDSDFSKFSGLKIINPL